MRKGVFLILINMMILLVVFALMMQSMLIVQRLAAADQLTGQVEVQRSGEGDFKPLKKGDFVKTRDVIRTGADGTAEFSWADGTRWKLMPNSQITVKKATFNSLKKAEQSELQLSAGKIFIRILKKLSPASRFEVETPTAVAAVRGTIFSVEVEGDETKVSVYKGSVQVSEPRSDNSEAIPVGTTIAPGEIGVTAASGRIQSTQDSQTDADFLRQTSIVQPELSTSFLMLKEDKGVIIKGKTEVGNSVTINGRAANVLGNGAFNLRFPLQPGVNNFVVVSRDKHGQETRKIQTVQSSDSNVP